MPTWACPVIWVSLVSSFTSSRFYQLQKEGGDRAEELNKNRTWFSSGCPWPRQSTESWGEEKGCGDATTKVPCPVDESGLLNWHVNWVGPFCILAKAWADQKTGSDHSSRGQCKGWAGTVDLGNASDCVNLACLCIPRRAAAFLGFQARDQSAAKRELILITDSLAPSFRPWNQPSQIPLPNHDETPEKWNLHTAFRGSSRGLGMLSRLRVSLFFSPLSLSLSRSLLFLFFLYPPPLSLMGEGGW